MRDHFLRFDIKKYSRIAVVLLGVALNVLLAYVASRLGVPVYLDTTGTVLVTALAGAVPGLFAAVFTNILCSAFNENAIFYTVVSISIVYITHRYITGKEERRKSHLVLFLLLLLVVSGTLAFTIQWLILGEAQFGQVTELAKVVTKHTGIASPIAIFIVNQSFNAIDKLTTLGAAYMIYSLFPTDVRHQIRDARWRQKPLSRQEAREILRNRKFNSLQRKITVMLVVAAVSMTAVMVWISLKLFTDSLKAEYREKAQNVANLAADVIDGNSVALYLEKEGKSSSYIKTKGLIRTIWDNNPGVEYIYAVQVDKQGFHYIFDIDTPTHKGASVGEVEAMDEGFTNQRIALLAGRAVQPIVTKDDYGWFMTAFAPVKDKAGDTVCYAAADISMTYMNYYVRMYLIKATLLFLGFFCLILGYGLHVARQFIIYPVNAMTGCVKEFMSETENQEALDANVKNIRALDIRTNDEVEELYQNLCRMESNLTEQMRSMIHYANTTAKMQNGLIITMADMVENRDSDTGDHIQKTAEYVKIIVDGLKRKGYYEEKLTPKFMSDVVISAPLHDVGKITISDIVLNKPDKLSDDEFEIMKSHTTSGRKILEKAIGTVEGENYLKEARNMAAYHHERWDGKGYPEGLHGEVIPLSARIMAVADVFDALTSPRIYKPAFSLHRALEILEEGAGTQFDPKCVEAFIDSLPEVKAVLKKYHGSNGGFQR